MNKTAGALPDCDAMACNEAAAYDLCDAHIVPCRHVAIEDADDHDGE